MSKTAAWAVAAGILASGLALAEAQPAAPAPQVSITKVSNLDPPSADATLAVAVRIRDRGQGGEYAIECEILDYWFRSSLITKTLSLGKGETQEVVLALDGPTRQRLFRARSEAGANVFRVRVVLKRGSAIVARAGERTFRFKNRLKSYAALPELPGRWEKVDDLFGRQKLVDEIRCYDPSDPHPYMEGGRGLGSKATGGVPQYGWKDMYREPNPHFTTIDSVLGKRCRVAHGWGWFGYKLNRKGLKPGQAYLIVVEYPEDKGRTFNIWNTGAACAMAGDYGFHTGRTLGDHWTRTLNSEYVDYPLSRQYRKWYSLFYLHEKTWARGDPYKPHWRGHTMEGFWLIVGGVGPSMDALSAGAAVRSIKLYQIDDAPSLFPRINEPPLELGRRQIISTSEHVGHQKFERDRHDVWARQMLYQAKFLGLTGIAPNKWGSDVPLLQTVEREKLAIDIIPRVMIDQMVYGRVFVSEDMKAIASDGQPYPLSRHRRNPPFNLVHPDSLREACALLGRMISPSLGNDALAGVMLFKHYGYPLLISFGEDDLRRFEAEAGRRLEGAHTQARREWLLENMRSEYCRWWHGKKREFLLHVRDFLRGLRPDLKLHYFPWHSDDDYPFSCGRLRYSGHPLDDQICIPGTNILLVPTFTKPPAQWSEEERRQPMLARHYYREAVAPELRGKVSLEDILYGRHKDMREFWGGKRSGAVPHMMYPEQMDLVRMFCEPGSMYSPFGQGCSPQLYANDDGIVYWAPVHYKFAADNPKFLNLFKTGEGVAVANHFPYNEETGHNNTYNLHCAGAVEHAGAFCMMEEVLSVVHADPSCLMVSMWQPPKRGFPRYAREFAAAYRALPTTGSEILERAVTPADADVVVRSYRTDYGLYLAVVNRALELGTKHVKVRVKPDFREIRAVEDLVSGEALPYRKASSGMVEIALAAKPMQLRALRIVPIVPPVAFRDVELSSDAFSPNGDGRRDAVSVTGRTVVQVTEGRWRAEIVNRDGQSVWTSEGPIPQVSFSWNGRDRAAAPVPEGVYTVRLKATQSPDSVLDRQIVVDTTAPAAPPAQPSQTLNVNHTVLNGRIAHPEPGARLLLLRRGEPERRIVLHSDGTFSDSLEGLCLGENRLGLTLEDAAGNRSPVQTMNLQFAFGLGQPIGFDFGAGPIMEGFSAIRNDTRYSDPRGYGWIKYHSTWLGDRGKGDRLVRDYCSGKEDREWAVRLPNGRYKATIVMVDTRFDQWSADVYVEGKKVVEHQRIKENKPFRPSFEVDMRDGLMNFVFDNPGRLPFFALNGIIIESCR